MNRGDFLRRLIALGGFSFLPVSGIKTYQKYYLLQCFIRGFRFYEGPNLLSQMKEGDMLELVREIGNQYDANAIALHWNKQKIGFIPAESNEVLAKLLDIQMIDLIAEITFLQPAAATWENVSIALFVLKEIAEAGTMPPGVQNLTQLVTPCYHTLKRENNKVTKISYAGLGENEEYETVNYYDFLVGNSSDDSVYDYIHNQLDPYANYEEQIDYFVVDLNKLANNPAIEELVKRAESGLYNLNDMFDEKGYVVLAANKAKGLVKSIVGLKDVADKIGRKFIELEF